VPVYSGDAALIGGVGVSNLHEDQDEAVAVFAVEAAGFGSDFPN
jgi:uncharacterized protein GlcG (DUF336 family)